MAFTKAWLMKAVEELRNDWEDKISGMAEQQSDETLATILLNTLANIWLM